jgi:hypothetical protein
MVAILAVCFASVLLAPSPPSRRAPERACILVMPFSVIADPAAQGRAAARLGEARPAFC